MAAETTTPKEPEPSRFSVPGDEKEYELPNIRELTVDEWMLMYEYSKVTLRDIMELDDPDAEQARIDKLEQPGVMKALFHIGYKRAHPKKTDAAIKDLVGTIVYLPMLVEMSDEEEEGEEQEDPTQATTELASEPSDLEPSSEKSSDSSIENGSSDSATSSETPEDLPATIGTSG